MSEMKERLDVYLVKNGIIKSRERAKELITKGGVCVNGSVAKKSGQQVDEADKIEINESLQNPYVSRGGLKMEKAISSFELCLDGMTAIDIGASCGGFTDCMLKNGAKKVYAVDVGYGQLDETLKNDSRVLNLEQTDIRSISVDDLEEVDFISIDVSFISLTKVLPQAKAFLKKDGKIAALIKPQFEAGKSNLNKKGVVKDKKVHITVIQSVTDFAKSIGFSISGLDFSPVRGPEGNIEYLLLLSFGQQQEINIKEVVEASHRAL